MSLSPFDILGVPPDAGDEAIRRAYLEKVRQHPPERDPEAFQAVRWAYEQVKDERSRIRHCLFHLPEVEEIARMLPPARPSLAQFRKLLRACAGEGDRGQD